MKKTGFLPHTLNHHTVILLRQIYEKVCNSLSAGRSSIISSPGMLDTGSLTLQHPRVCHDSFVIVCSDPLTTGLFCTHSRATLCSSTERYSICCSTRHLRASVRSIIHSTSHCSSPFPLTVVCFPTCSSLPLHWPQRTWLE